MPSCTSDSQRVDADSCPPPHAPDGDVVRIRHEPQYSDYRRLHERRFRHSIEALRRHAAGRVLEIGGHPWAMTALIAATPKFELAATISAEEATFWPDDIGVSSTTRVLETGHGVTSSFTNYAVNIERTVLNLSQPVDAVFACEVAEHLVRAPHMMFLNINRWLKLHGKMLVTTPNGMQFSNPFRRKNARPAYRCHCYERHNGLLTLEHLEDFTVRSGFRILESGYWNVYARRGLSLMYDLPSLVPLPYFRAKFSRTVFVIGEKIEEVAALRGLPKAYVPHPDWEYIDQSADMDYQPSR